jgi:hypothetical protein
VMQPAVRSTSAWGRGAGSKSDHRPWRRPKRVPASGRPPRRRAAKPPGRLAGRAPHVRVTILSVGPRCRPGSGRHYLTSAHTARKFAWSWVELSPRKTKRPGK